jgi:hypothetical protein
MNEASKQRNLRIDILSGIFNLFPSSYLAENEFHLQIIQVIESDPSVGNKRRAAKIFGSKVVVPLIKSKRYRKTLTAFVDSLRLSKNFRDRQLYLLIAKATYKAD